jgi:uncharacterized membrane protein
MNYRVPIVILLLMVTWAIDGSYWLLAFFVASYLLGTLDALELNFYDEEADLWPRSTIWWSQPLP